MTYVIAFDFETFGPIPTINGFAQLGAVAGCLTTGDIIETFSEYAKQNDYVSDKKCIETFWLEKKELYEHILSKCENSVTTPQEVIALFINWIQKFVEKYGNSVYLITDCSTFDSGILKAFSLCDTLKIITSKPRNIIDTASYYLGVSGLFMTEDIVDGTSFEMARKALGLKEFKSTVTADHNALNDSTEIFEKWVYIQNGILEKN